MPKTHLLWPTLMALVQASAAWATEPEAPQPQARTHTWAISASAAYASSGQTIARDNSVSLYEFESRLQTVLHHPRNFMLLNCPERIRQTRLRSHERVKCALPVQIDQAPSGPVPAGAYAFHDLSGSGAALVGPVALGQPGQPLQLQLAFDLAATGTHEQLTLLAHIQTVQPLRNGSGQTTGFQHGILFEQVEPRILLLVNELQKPQAH